MLDKVLPTIIGELNRFLKSRFEETEDKAILSDLVTQDGSIAFHGENKIVGSLLNIEQERVNLNYTPPSSVKTNPPINLNLYVIFSAYFPGNYKEALKFLSSVIGFFQGKQVFTPNNTPELDSNLEKITIEIVNMDMHQLSNLWATIGAKVIPSITYKIRMIAITRDIILDEIPVIEAIDTEQKS